MKPLLPVFCRLMGYAIIAIALFLPFLMVMLGRITDSNLVFYKECVKLLMMLGCVMIIFAYHKHESPEFLQVRNAAVRNAIFFTILYVFGNMVYRVMLNDIASVDGSSFLIFLMVNVVCLEFGLKKASVDRLFKNKSR